MAFIPNIDDKNKALFDASAVNENILKMPPETYQSKNYLVAQDDADGKYARSNYSTELLVYVDLNKEIDEENMKLYFPHVYAANEAAKKSGDLDFLSREKQAVSEHKPDSGGAFLSGLKVTLQPEPEEAPQAAQISYWRRARQGRKNKRKK